MKKVSIHLVTYNGEKYIPFVLQSIKEQIFKDFNLLIIDNNSQDNTVDAIEALLLRPQYKNKALKKVTTFIKNSRNHGFAGGHNQAIQWTKSQYVFMINQDMILDENYLKHLVHFADSHENGASFTGTLYKWDFHSYTSETAQQDTLTSHGKTDKIDTLGLFIYRHHRVVELTETDHKKGFEVFGVSGALPLYRRSALEATKIPLFDSSWKRLSEKTEQRLYEFFDNDFHSYKEDVDLAYRLRLAGYRAYCVPFARAWHNRSASQSAGVAKNRKNKSTSINYHSYKNHLFFLIKNVPSKLWFRYGFAIISYETIKFFFVLFFEFKTLRAYRAFWKLFFKMEKKRRYIQKKVGKDAWQYIAPWLK